MVRDEGRVEREKYSHGDASLVEYDPKQDRAMAFFGVFILLIFGVMLMGPWVPVISDYALPLVGILFLIGGLGAGFLGRRRENCLARAARRVERACTLGSSDPYGGKHPLYYR